MSQEKKKVDFKEKMLEASKIRIEKLDVKCIELSKRLAIMPATFLFSGVSVHFFGKTAMFGHSETSTI